MIFHPIFPAIICIILAAFVLGLLLFCAVDKKHRTGKNFRRLGILACLVLTIMRPAVPVQSSENVRSKINVFFIADMTGSMVARDAQGNKRRYELMQEDILKIAEAFQGANYSIISLSQSPRVNSPLSDNFETLESGVRSLALSPTAYASSSDLADLLDFSAAKIQKYSQRYPDYKNIVFFMSDGEDINGTTSVNGGLKNNIYGGRVYGYGSKKGIMIENIDTYGNIGNYYVRDGDDFGSDYHVSKLNDDNLRNISDKLGLSYTYRSTASIDTSSLEELIVGAETEIKDGNELSYHEGYWICALVFAALLMWDSCYVITELMRERKFAK